MITFIIGVETVAAPVFGVTGLDASSPGYIRLSVQKKRIKSI